MGRNNGGRAGGRDAIFIRDAVGAVDGNKDGVAVGSAVDSDEGDATDDDDDDDDGNDGKINEGSAVR